MTQIPAHVDTVVPDPDASHIRVTVTDADQPFHCTLVAGNSEPTWWTENYTDRDGAKAAILWLGRFVSPVGRSTAWIPMTAPESSGYLEVWLDDDELGQKVHIPVRYVDQRHPADPAGGAW
jgi:hypothetical protein